MQKTCMIIIAEFQTTWRKTNWMSEERKRCVNNRRYWTTDKVDWTVSVGPQDHLIKHIPWIKLEIFFYFSTRYNFSYYLLKEESCFENKFNQTESYQLASLSLDFIYMLENVPVTPIELLFNVLWSLMIIKHVNIINSRNFFMG